MCFNYKFGYWWTKFEVLRDAINLGFDFNNSLWKTAVSNASKNIEEL
jgi:hypothetical protein